MTKSKAVPDIEASESEVGSEAEVVEAKALSESGWRYRHYTDFYLDCLKQGHDLRIFEAGGYFWSAYCVECDLVWRLYFAVHSRLLSTPREKLAPAALADCDRFREKII